MTIVDSSVWVDWLRDHDTPQANWLRSSYGQDQRIALTDVILCEVLQGARENSVPFLQRQLQQFHVFNSGGAENAVAAACNYRYLRTRGHTVRKLADCLIATFCIRNRHTLLHSDRDFDPFEKHLGLRVLHP